MRKKIKEEKFIQLGMTRNGRIVKNERYSFDDLEHYLSGLSTKSNLSLVERLSFALNKNKFDHYCNKILLKMGKKLLEDFDKKIDEDNFGKKEKKRESGYL